MRDTRNSTSWPPDSADPRAAAGKSRGFTLLEVMIALAILGIALVSILSLGNRSLEVAGRLEQLTQATLLAQDKMSEIEVVARGQTISEEEGAFTGPFEDYRWRVALAGTPLPSISQVTVTVSWGDEARNEAVDLTSFIAQR